ncbi:hypothetical protein F4167_05450 [Candidatus Poribacteria bacterium]|nr:hypothetical protein [Candidatus Poribacteria bacterium]
MFFRKNWVPIPLFVLAMVGVGLYYLQTRSPKPPIKIYKPVEVEEPVAKPPPPGASPNGHWHGDEWHEGPHETHDPPAVPAVSGSVPPGAATKPDFPPVDANDDPVAAAYKRLDYISKNPYAWGGVHSERATGLIAQLMPPQKSRDHDHGDEVHDYLVELIAQGDPRAGEVIIANICDGSVDGNMLIDALVVIGPPAVPYILHYLEEFVRQGGTTSISVFWSLGGISTQYRDDLGGIVDHIIIPKLEVIAADEDGGFYDHPMPQDARKTLSLLGQ